MRAPVDQRRLATLLGTGMSAIGGGVQRTLLLLRRRRRRHPLLGRGVPAFGDSIAGQVLSDVGSTRNLEHGGAGLGSTTRPGESTGGAGPPFVPDGNIVFGVTLDWARAWFGHQLVSIPVGGLLRDDGRWARLGAVDQLGHGQASGEFQARAFGKCSQLRRPPWAKGSE